MPPTKPPKHAPELVTRAELARRRGCSRAAVTQALAGALAAAVVGNRVDAAHPLVIEWIAKGPNAPTVPPSKSKANGSSNGTTNGADKTNGAEHHDEQHHEQRDAAHHARLLDLTTRKREAEVQRLEQRNNRDNKLLISRELVSRHVFGYLNGLSVRLLKDGIKTASLRAFHLARHPDGTLEQVEAAILDVISSILETTKRETRNRILACTVGASGIVPELAEREEPREPRPMDLIEPLLRVLYVDAAPRVVELVAKAIGRKASGKPWHAEVFDDVMRVHGDVADETVSAVASVLGAHVERALRETQRAVDEHEPPREADA